MSESVPSARLQKLIDFVKEMPTTPGVYLMKSRVDKIIYVGKAKNLKNRVRSYFGSQKNISPKTVFLVSQIHSIDYILTETEVEAFLLEASLIKKHRPRYNIRLKDDKAYPYIRLSQNDKFPRLYLARKVKKDGSLYFGPYTSGWAVNDTIRFLNKSYQLRDCKDSFFKTRKRPCMTHQIGRCTAPCVSAITSDEYQKDVKLALSFLKGKNKKTLKDMTRRMKDLALEERFEAAAKLRDSIQAIKAVLEKQAVVNDQTDCDQDVIGFHGDERGTLIETLHVRQGRVIGTRSHFMPLLNVDAPGEDIREWLVSFINQYYLENIIPDQVLLSVDIRDDMNTLLGQVLEERSGHPVKVYFATSTSGQALVSMVEKNAQSHFNRYVSKSEAKIQALEYIQKKLKLPKLPRRIECYDISTFQGQETVASQVVFEDGVPHKDDYRRYKMRTLEGQQNDFAAMKEVLERRLAHTEYEDPDLLVIDGGKGQLGMVVEVLKEMEREELPVVGLAKARVQGEFTDKEVESTQERFFLPGRQNPVIFNRSSEALNILVGIRDEAHRFAITYHRKLREASSLESELDHISGLGEKRKKLLLDKFKTVDQIREADPKEISELSGFNEDLAERVLVELNSQE